SRRAGRFTPSMASMWAQAPSFMTTSSLVEHLVDERDRARAFAHGGRHALHAAPADVAHREHAGQAGLEHVARAAERPARRGEVVLGQVRPGLDESLPVEREAALEPGRARIAAGHDEQVADG